jgi:MATE family multidrug resistance protein
VIALAGPILASAGVSQALVEPSAQVAAILALSLPFHLAFVAGAYFLEGIEKPAAATTMMWLANGVNITANAALVPGLGAEGSAWGTLIARVFLVGGLFAWIVWRYRGRGYGVLDRPDALAPRFSALAHIGFASALSQVFEAGAFSAMTVLAGRLGDTAVSAYQILLNLLAVVFMVAMGLATASAVLTSEAKGRGDREAVRRVGWLGLGVNTVLMLGAGVLALIGAEWIARAYTSDAALAGLIIGAMGLVALILAPDGGQVVAASTLRALGDNWFPTASHMVAYVVVMPPLAFWLAEVMGRGVIGLMEAIFWASVLSAAILTARFWALTRMQSVGGPR